MPELVGWLLRNEPEFNEKRLPSLYSDLAQQKDANPDGFQANATVWEKALLSAALAAQLPAGQKIVLATSADLLNALRSPRYGQPNGLGFVLDDAVRNGKMLDLKAFTESPTSIYQKSWVPSLGTIVKWTLRQAGLWQDGSFDQSGRLRAGQLVMVDALEQVTQFILEHRTSLGQSVTDRVLTRDAFAQEVATTPIGTLNSQDLECLLRYLSRDKHILSYDAQTVKFKLRPTEQAEPISEEDRTLASLKTLIKDLETQVQSLISRISTLQDAAQSAVRSKHQHAARSALRSKKLAETNLQQRTEMLHQLEQVYTKIEQAADQVQYVRAMQSSADTLRSLNQKVGGVDKVDAIMDDLREQMTQTEDVSQVMQEQLGGPAAVDDMDVADELEALEKEELERKEDIKAEATRKKLSELESSDSLTQEKITAQQKKDADDNELEKELQNSSEKLQRMQLNDTNNSTKQPERSTLEATS